MGIEEIKSKVESLKLAGQIKQKSPHFGFAKSITGSPQMASFQESGIPVWLGLFASQIFEGLPEEDALTWPGEFLTAIEHMPDFSQARLPLLRVVASTLDTNIEEINDFVNFLKEDPINIDLMISKRVFILNKYINYSMDDAIYPDIVCATEIIYALYAHDAEIPCDRIYTNQSDYVLYKTALLQILSEI